MVDSGFYSNSKQAVYLVEDHELFTLGLQRMIEESPDFSFAGHASGVLTAVSEIRRLQPEIVLVDLQLKGESGLALIRTLRAQGDLPLIAVITNHNDPRLVASCEQAGANAFILKEEPLHRVLAKMKRMRPLEWEAEFGGSTRRTLASDVPPSSEVNAWASLSPREIECMKLLAFDLQQVDVAKQLHISLNTLKNHRKNIYKKMGFKSKTDLVLFCRENELL